LSECSRDGIRARHGCKDISTIVARESDRIGFTLVFWSFGRGYEPRPDRGPVSATSEGVEGTAPRLALVVNSLRVFYP
jgi:hypothetical protein